MAWAEVTVRRPSQRGYCRWPAVRPAAKRGPKETRNQRADPMKDFAGKIAVVTGGGSGMGRELVRQLAAEGASVAMCDVSMQTMEETKALCEKDGLPQGVKIACYVVDVSDEPAVLAMQAAVARDFATDK